MWDNGKAYFFKGQDYARIDLSTKRKDDGYPWSISGHWPGLWSSDIDAVTMWRPDSEKQYLCADNEWEKMSDE